MNVQFICDLLNDIKRLLTPGQVLEAQSHHQEDFRHRDFRGCFIVVVVFYFARHTYNYSLNGERALIYPKLENRIIILGQKQ